VGLGRTAEVHLGWISEPTDLARWMATVHPREALALKKRGKISKKSDKSKIIMATSASIFFYQ
jgi:hypothetical protein